MSVEPHSFIFCLLEFVVYMIEYSKRIKAKKKGLTLFG